MLIAATTAPALLNQPADIVWPLRQPVFRMLESWSGHRCDTFMQQDDPDPECHRGFADWECEHGVLVWHYDLHAAAERALATQERLRLA